MTERRCRGFPFNARSPVYNTVTVSYANKLFNLHSDDSLTSAGAEAQEYQEFRKCSESGSWEELIICEKFKKTSSNKKANVATKSDVRCNKLNAAEKPAQDVPTASKAQSMPTTVCQVEDEEPNYRIITIRIRKPLDIRKMMMKNLTFCLKWGGYLCGGYFGVGITYLILMESPVGQLLDSYGAGTIRPVFSPITYIFNSIRDFVSGAFDGEGEPLPNQRNPMASGSEKSTTYGFFQTYCCSGADIGMWEAADDPPCLDF